MSVPFLQTSPFWVDPLRRIDATLPLNSLPSLTPPHSFQKAFADSARTSQTLPGQRLPLAARPKHIHDGLNYSRTGFGRRLALGSRRYFSPATEHAAESVAPPDAGTNRSPRRIPFSSWSNRRANTALACDFERRAPPHFDRRRLSATGNIGAHNTPATTTKNTAQRLHAPFFNRPKRHCRHKLKHGP